MVSANIENDKSPLKIPRFVGRVHNVPQPGEAAEIPAECNYNMRIMTSGETDGVNASAVPNKTDVLQGFLCIVLVINKNALAAKSMNDQLIANEVYSVMWRVTERTISWRRIPVSTRYDFIIISVPTCRIWQGTNIAGADQR